jgi:4-diphosphocytidyl-2-C-methyl-D-erythritol kinase
MLELRMIAPAKVNFSLRVIGRRDDGYHLLDMIMAPLTWGDTVTISLDRAMASPPDEWRQCWIDGILLQTAHPTLPLDEANLLTRAAQAMRQVAGRDDPMVITIDKQIPMGAGLGGGSSDAATVMMALNRLWNLGLSREALAEHGLPLGADVPFFFWESPARVEGIGERITLCERFPNIPILLVNPNIHVSTATIFSQVRGLTRPNVGARVRPLFERLGDVTPILVNDLERITAAQFPVIAAITHELERAGAAASIMSGSGPTVCGLFASTVVRDQAAQTLQNRGWWLKATESSGRKAVAGNQ